MKTHRKYALSFLILMAAFFTARAIWELRHDAHHDHDHGHSDPVHHLRLKNDGRSHSHTHQDGAAIAEEIIPAHQILREKAAHLKRAIAAHPEKSHFYTALAQVYYQLSRDGAHQSAEISKALSLVEQGLVLAPDDYEARLTQATLLLSMHRFEAALSIAVVAAAENPHSAFVQGLLCDAYLELGRYNLAVEACDRMLAIRPDLRAYSRAAYLRELHGDLPGAIAAMTLAVKAGAVGTGDRAWVLCQLAHLYYGQGDVGAAARIYSGVLVEYPNYPRAVDGLASVAAANDNLTDAINRLESALDSVPDHELMEKLALLYAASDGHKEKHPLSIDVMREYRFHGEAGMNANLELARFCADLGIELDLAQEKIEQEYRRRPGNIDVLDTYAWVLYQRGDAQRASFYLQKAMRLNTRRAGMNYHAAMIYKALGDKNRSLHYQDLCLQQFSILPPHYKFEAQAFIGSPRELTDKAAAIH